MRLRQVVVASSDLGGTRRAIEDELGLSHVWADPGVATFGLRNALYLAGDTFVEVVSPTTPTAAAARFMNKRGGDGGYMVIVQVDENLDAVRARAAKLGVREVFTAKTDGIEGASVVRAPVPGEPVVFGLG